ncbi:hypothetical protein BH10ACT2_BH10ACT2_09530 [soil metagenome]
MTSQIIFKGIDGVELDAALVRGIDHGDNPIESFIDGDGGWPLRCCLGNSQPGDRIAIVAWSPFDWRGPYRETGPIVVHTEPCQRATELTSLPDDLNCRAMTLRPYGRDHTILYDRVRHVSAGGDLTASTRELFADEAVGEVHAKNATGGCFAYVATSPQLHSPQLPFTTVEAAPK